MSLFHSANYPPLGRWILFISICLIRPGTNQIALYARSYWTIRIIRSPQYWIFPGIFWARAHVNTYFFDWLFSPLAP